MGNKTI